MHILQVHSASSCGFGAPKTNFEVVGVASTAGRVNLKISVGRSSAFERTGSDGDEVGAVRVNVKNGKAGLAILSALSLADR